MGENLWLRAKPKLKIKVVWNTRDKERGGEMKFVNKTTLKFHLKTAKVTPFQRNLCKIFRQKQYIGIVYSYILSFLCEYSMTKAHDTYSINV